MPLGYVTASDQIVPGAMKMNYPRVRKGEAANVATALFDLVRKALEHAERPNSL